MTHVMDNLPIIFVNLIIVGKLNILTNFVRVCVYLSTSSVRNAEQALAHGRMSAKQNRIRYAQSKSKQCLDFPI